MNFNQYTPGQNTSYAPNTTNLGFGSGPATPWDSSPQNSGAYSQNPQEKLMGAGGGGFGGAPSGGAGGFGGGGAGFNPNTGASGGGQGQLPYNLGQLMQMQLGQNGQARQQNQNTYNTNSSYIKQFSNPLSPAMIQQMQTANAVRLQGGQDNAGRQQAAMMSASGQGDAGSLAAAGQANARANLGAQSTANMNLGFDAAKLNNAAGLSVGQSLLAGAPQYKPDDYSGLMGLTLMQQQLGNQNAILANQTGGPRNPVTTNGQPMVGFGDPFQSRRSGGGGFGGGYASYDPNGTPGRVGF